MTTLVVTTNELRIEITLLNGDKKINYCLYESMYDVLFICNEEKYDIVKLYLQFVNIYCIFVKMKYSHYM